jgi:hypothetical protein
MDAGLSGAARLEKGGAGMPVVTKISPPFAPASEGDRPMSEAIEQPRRMHALHLFSVAAQMTIVLAWAGIVPVWALLPPAGQDAVEPVLSEMFWPALALCGAILLVTLLRLAGMLQGLADRLAGLGLAVGGVAFSCLAVKALAGFSFASWGLSPNGMLVAAVLHAGASFATPILPWIAVIVLVTGLLNIMRRAGRPA